MDPAKKIDLLNLPIVMIEHIFSFLTYDEIAKTRVVCKDFNEICQRMLNRGFLMIEKRHNTSLKNVKAQLPRRESERRYHPLARHCDILTSIETRISMLNMTYAKFIDNSMCCFIPGKVIDEIQRILNTVEKSNQPLRAHEVLQELRDISSMAIEHFDDKISPAFRKKLQQETNARSTPETVVSSRLQLPNLLAGNPSLWFKEFINIRRRVTCNMKMLTSVNFKNRKLAKKLQYYKKLTARQGRNIRELIAKQNIQDSSIADLKKKIEEYDIKYSELTHSNVGGKRSVLAAPIPSSTKVITHQPFRDLASRIKFDLSVMPLAASNTKHAASASNIKPRKSVIDLPPLTQNEKATNSSSSEWSEPLPQDRQYSRLGKRSFSESTCAIDKHISDIEKLLKRRHFDG